MHVAANSLKSWHQNKFYSIPTRIKTRVVLKKINIGKRDSRSNKQIRQSCHFFCSICFIYQLFLTMLKPWRFLEGKPIRKHSKCTNQSCGDWTLLEHSRIVCLIFVSQTKKNRFQQKRFSVAYACFISESVRFYFVSMNFIVELSKNWQKITTFLFYYITRRFHVEKKIIVCLQKQVKQNSRIQFTNYLDFLMKQKTGIP